MKRIDRSASPSIRDPPIEQKSFGPSMAHEILGARRAPSAFWAMEVLCHGRSQCHGNTTQNVHMLTHVIVPHPDDQSIHHQAGTLSHIAAPHRRHLRSNRRSPNGQGTELDLDLNRPGVVHGHALSWTPWARPPARPPALESESHL